MASFRRFRPAGVGAVSTSAVEAVLMGALTAVMLAALVVALRRRRWNDVVVYGTLTVLGLFMTALTSSGVVFVGPGGHGGISIP